MTEPPKGPAISPLARALRMKRIREPRTRDESREPSFGAAVGGEDERVTDFGVGAFMLQEVRRCNDEKWLPDSVLVKFAPYGDGVFAGGVPRFRCAAPGAIQMAPLRGAGGGRNLGEGAPRLASAGEAMQPRMEKTISRGGAETRRRGGVEPPSAG